jgi:drug/metabolite transporter (DMT)-like permease
VSRQEAQPPRSTQLAVLVPFGIVTLIWGSTWIVIAGQVGSVPASWSVCYRFLVASVAMLGWAAVRRERLWLGWPGLTFAAMVGVAQFVLNFNFVYRAEAHVTSGLVAIVYALLLVPNALFARFFLGQRLGRQLLVGSAIAVAGVALLFLHEARSTGTRGGHEAALGIGLALIGVLCASVANVLQATERAKRWPMASTLGWAMLIGAAVDAVVAFALSGPPMFDARPSYLAGILYLGLMGSAVTFPLYFGVIRAIGPAKAAYSSVLIPVIAMIFSTLLEGYRWSWLAAAGALLVLAGLVTALRARRPNR